MNTKIKIEKEGWEKEICSQSYDRFADGSRYRRSRRIDKNQADAILHWIMTEK